MAALMVQGCTSSAGKSWLVTALCRWFADRGVAVAPFKAQNMSNNARVVAGGEIGVAQWLQARAARVTPEVRMNPVLLKPQAGGSQVIRLGRVDDALTRRPWRGRSQALWPTAESALADLLDAYDLVVIEGAGSPAEINLDDMVNMRVADRADAPVLLVVDIDRGGAFAHLYGTWSLLADRHRDRLRGFVLNRFRGDPRLLDPAPGQLERLTGVPTLGVVPLLEHGLPDEDGASSRPARSRYSGDEATDDVAVVAIVQPPTGSNLDEFAPLDQVADVRWVRDVAGLAGADLIVLPGSKHVAADLAWLRRRGFDVAIRAAAGRGTRVLGICGGLQLLGERLEDPHRVDGSGPGLGLLPVVTTYEPAKRVRPTTTRFAPVLPAPWDRLAGLEVSAYEIRHGRTEVTRPLAPCLPDGLGWVAGPVAGVYLHGLLEHADVLEALVGRRPAADLDATFDRLAAAVDRYLDTDRILELTGVA